VDTRTSLLASFHLQFVEHAGLHHWMASTLQGQPADTEKLNKRIVDQEHKHADLSAQLASERRASRMHVARVGKLEHRVDALSRELAQAITDAESAHHARQDMRVQRDSLAMQLAGMRRMFSSAET
jgi:septal ring factor EnvC (AmiA/AmiB activator)